MKDLRHKVFWPTFLFLLLSVSSSILFKNAFLENVNSLNEFLLKYFGVLLNVVVGIMVITCLIIPFTELGKIKIGGAKAIPILSRLKWFAIVLCTTIATGILFWGTVEPLAHFNDPPNIENLVAQSENAIYFSLSNMFLHWSFTPYAIYAIPALMFAIAYYNKEESFSLSSTLFPLFNLKQRVKLGLIIDNVSLFALVMGMSASLGAGILTLRGGIERFVDIPFSSEVFTFLVALVIIISFIASASTGLLKGIKNLSFLNLLIFVFILLFVIATGFTEAYSYFIPSLKAYIAKMTYDAGFFLKDMNWANQWTTFYWANWMAWAPITALFLGRLAYGRTVREFLLVNWVLPSIFAIIWMTVFGGNILFIEFNGIIDLTALVEAKGPQSVVYSFFNILPFAPFIIGLFIFTIYISYVTAADSNTEAMGGISSLGITPESPSPSVPIKVLWGVIIGTTAITAINFAGIKGIKMLSNLGGIPAMFLMIFILLALYKFMFSIRRKK